jgi:hypothetical protein
MNRATSQGFAREYADADQHHCHKMWLRGPKPLDARLRCAGRRTPRGLAAAEFESLKLPFVHSSTRLTCQGIVEIWAEREAFRQSPQISSKPTGPS